MNWSRKQLLKMRRNIHLAAESLPDNDAAETPEIFEAWEPDKTYAMNKRLKHVGKLWKCLQATIVSSADYPPGAPGTESLYAEIPKPGAGTRDNPIVYNGNMALENGKYYAQNGVEYYCFRDTINPVFDPLANLVELYVRVVTD